ncbi:MAG TPA: NAD(P)-binding domain-containing protein [Kofleriaceae bacterium]|jgi:hypothetical protein|nr:NAD(P)-binding domain-containing protein [Kofleriaceae bacterium]
MRLFLSVLVVTVLWSASGHAAPPDAHRLKIGIIGTGQIGGSLARLWVAAGHEVLMSSRHPDELKPLAKQLGPRARVGTPREAAAFDDVARRSRRRSPDPERASPVGTCGRFAGSSRRGWRARPPRRASS